MIRVGSFIYSRQYAKALMMFVVGKLVFVVGRKDDIKNVRTRKPRGISFHVL